MAFRPSARAAEVLRTSTQATLGVLAIAVLGVVGGWCRRVWSRGLRVARIDPMEVLHTE